MHNAQSYNYFALSVGVSRVDNDVNVITKAEILYCIELALSYDKIEDYSKFLKEKSKRYTIENGVAAIIRACNL